MIVDEASADVTTMEEVDVMAAVAVAAATAAADAAAFISSTDAAESGDARQLIGESPEPLPLLPFTYK